MKDFKDRVAVITGGASGVGRSLAFALGREGARVVIGDVDAPALEATLAQLRDVGIDAIAERADVTSAASMSALAGQKRRSAGLSRAMGTVETTARSVFIHRRLRDS